MFVENYSEKEMVAAEQNVKEKEYWSRQLTGEPGEISFPYDRRRLNKDKTPYEKVEFQFSGELFEKLNRLSRGSDHALHMILTAGLAVLLEKYTGNTDISIVSPIYNPRIKGEFINTVLPLRCRVNPAKTFKELLNQVREVVDRAVENQNFPVKILIKDSPPFDTAILLKNIHDRAHLQPFYPNMIFSFSREAQLLEGTLEYNGLLYKSSTVHRIIGHFTGLYRRVLSNLDIMAGDIDILSGEEKQKLLYEFNDTGAGYPQDMTITRLFERQVRTRPLKTAVTSGDHHLTYEELDIRADGLAGLLKAKGIKADRVVGLLLDRSVEMITGILGVLKAGGAYLPIEPTVPVKRIVSMLEDCGSSLILTRTGAFNERSFAALHTYSVNRREIHVTPLRPQILDFEQIPPPDRSLVNHEEYNRYIGQASLKDCISLQATRGCPYKCAYCHKIWPKRHVVRSARHIFDEVKLYYDLGIRRFALIDDIFNLNEKNSSEFFRMLIRHKMDVQLSFPNGMRGDIMTKDYIDLMVEAGVREVALALETGSPRLQKLLEKHINLEKLHENTRHLCETYPFVMSRLYTMLGFPSETEAEAMMTMNFIKSLKWLHWPYVFILKIYPNTDMARLAIENGVSPEAIAKSEGLAYHELPETLPFDKSFAREYQADYFNNYFLSKERLFHVLPHQLNFYTEDEIAQQYDGYLPASINSFDQLLRFLDIDKEQLGGTGCVEADRWEVPGLHEKIKTCFPAKETRQDALRILLLDLSTFFSEERDAFYDVIEPPLGLLYLLTYLKQEYGDKVTGKIAKSRMDFDNYTQLKELLEEFKPHVIGARTLSYFRDFYHKTLSIVRQFGFQGPIIAGGPYASSAYETILQDRNIDLVVLGEGEITFNHLIGEIIKNKGKLPGEEVLKEIKGTAFAARANGSGSRGREIVLLDSVPAGVRGGPPDSAVNINQPDHLAYIIYTSGSTGKPKGAMISHRNVVRLMVNDRGRFDFSHRDIWTMFHSYAFDFSVWEMYGALLYGGWLLMVPAEISIDPGRLAHLLKKNHVTVLNLTPTVFYYLAAEVSKNPGERLNLEYVIFGGEALTPGKLKEWKASQPRTKLINMYGITETTVHVTYKEIADREIDDGDVSNIGNPIPTLYTDVLDRRLGLPPMGVPGELCVGGAGVARGYLNRPELTAAKFVRDPHRRGQKLYRSGDLARWFENGDLEYLGRIDHQVKIRGFRLEPAEIEVLMTGHPGVKEAVVTTKEDRQGNKYLCAYFAFAAGQEVSIPVLRDHLSNELPDYMIPAYFIPLEKIPLTVNGKVDRKSLPEPHSVINDGSAAPANDLEKALADIWKKVLNLNKVGTDVSYFHVGGDSLRAINLVNSINSQLNANLKIVDIYHNQTIKQLADKIGGDRTLTGDSEYKKVLQEIAERKNQLAAEHKIPAHVEDVYPISDVQKGMLFYYLKESHFGTYHDQAVYQVKYKDFDLEIIKKALTLMTQKHPILRTGFLMEESVQVVYREVEVEVAHQDISFMEKSKQEDYIKEQLARNREKLFDISMPPLWRMTFFTIGDGKYALLGESHHAITDGWSNASLLTELNNTYLELKSNPDFKPKTLKNNYKSFIVDQLVQKRNPKAKEYWKNELIDYKRLEFPPEPSPYKRKKLVIQLGKPLRRKLEGTARELGVSFKHTCFAAYAFMLHMLTYENDFLVGLVTNNRPEMEDGEKMLGCFVNSVPVRITIPPNLKWSDYLIAIDKKMREVKQYDKLPLFDILRIIGEKTRDRNPLFDTLFNFIDFHVYNQVIYEEDQGDADDMLSLVGFENTNTLFDFSIGTTFDGFYVSFSYSNSLLNDRLALTLCEYFKGALNKFFEEPGSPVSKAALIPEAEKRELLYEFNPGVDEFPGDETLHGLFENQVEKTPTRTAAVHQDIHLTFKKLNERCNQGARVLRGKGVGKGAIVAIITGRSLEIITVILEILKSGGTYLPLDPSLPGERIVSLLKDCSARVLISDNQYPLGETITVLALASLTRVPGEASGENLAPTADALDFAYDIFTSGSTGNPKAVAVTHRNVTPLLHWGYKHLRLGPGDRVVQNLSYFFDWSVWEIFLTLTSGAGLYMVDAHLLINPPEYIEFMEKHAITVLHITPTHLHSLAASLSPGKKIGTLKHLCIGAEKLTANLVERSMELVEEDCRLFNMYGPTEAAIISAILEIDRGAVKKYGELSSVPIGQPVGCAVLLVLDKNRDMCPTGVGGELYIAGYGVSQGYLNNPELTAEKFDHDLWDYLDYHDEEVPFGQIKNAFGEKKLTAKTREWTRTKQPGQGGDRIHRSCQPHKSYIYKTGDLARWLPRGDIEFLGRIDNQVKIRGFRIELGEIENQLLKHPGIKEAVVLAQEEETGDKYLCAYVVSDKEYETPGLRKYLSKKLPDYMIPSYFVRLDKIPLTSHGKIDRRALPSSGIIPGEDYTPPRNKFEQQLVRMWAEILGLEEKKMGIDSDFFQLGGHSLKAMILVSKIHKEFDVKVPLVEIFRMSRIKELAKFIKDKTKEYYISIEPAEKKKYYILSSAQNRLYILQQMNPDSTAYNMPAIIPLAAAYDLGKIEETFKRMIKRHESLRTSFYLVNDTPVQVVHDEVKFEIENYNLATEETVKTPFKSKSQELRAKSYIKEFVRPFDLSMAPLLRIDLVNNTDGNNILLVDLHHIISDGVSHGILVKDFLALYEGEDLLPLRVQYKDFSQWQNGEKEKDNLKRQEEFWLKEFEGEIPVLELPTDYPRPVVQSFEGNSVNFEMTEEETQGLKAVALTGGCTLFMVLVSVVDILLSKLSGQEEIIIGTPIAGRRHADLEKIIGMFVNTLSLKNYPSGDRTLREFLGGVKEKTLMAFENQEYPFEELVNKLSVERDIGRNPLFDIMFVLQNMDTGSEGQENEKEIETTLPVQPGSTREYENTFQTAKFDLTFTAVEIGRKTLFTIQYCTKLFKQETIERFTRYFEKIVTSIVNDPDIKIQHIDIVSEKEKEQLLFDFNKTGEVYEKEKTIYRVFEEQVERTPGNIAVTGPSLEGDNVRLSYRELNEKSNQLAHTLKAKGITRHTVVGIMIRRSIEMTEAVLGILKACGAYMPIDPLYPRERQQRMLKDSAAKLLLTEGSAETGNIGNCEFIDIKNKDLFSANTGNPGIENLGNDLIYTIFTSGSTGLPKGSGVYHRGFVNLIHWYVKEFELNGHDGVLLLTSLSFDLTQKNIYAPLSVGGALHIPGSDYFEPSVLLQEVWRNKVTWINCTPGMFYKLVEVKDDRYLLSGLRYVFLGGEPISVKMLLGWLESTECNAELVNTYGPTECTDVCTYYRLNDWEHYREGVVPIGKPVYNTQLYVLNRDLQITPMGAVGELFIAGAGVGAGYINHSEMTWEKFIKISLNGSRPVVCYRTGDIARRLHTGNIEFLGRTDHQVKIRGFRVELGEIESRLLNYPGIREVVVWVREDVKDDKYICAYFVSDSEYRDSELRENLSKELPDYMIPSYFVQVEKIPLTPNGKVDRRALPKPELKTGESYTAPGNEIEKKLVDLWSEVLGRDELHTSQLNTSIGSDDNFFELGGHSLKATILVSKIHQVFNVKVPLVEIFKRPIIKELAKYIKGKRKDYYISIEPSEEKEYYPLSSAQKRLYILQQMNQDSIAYNMPEIIPLPLVFDWGKIDETFKRVIKRHESLRTSFHLVNDTPVQVVHDEVKFEIENYNLTTEETVKTPFKSKSQELRAKSYIKEFVRPFDLSMAPLLRIGLVNNIDGNNILLVDLHHIISDGVSHEILLRDFLALHEREDLLPLRVQYKDFSQWQNGEKEKDNLKRQEGYWMKEFEGEIPVLELPTDYPRPVVQSFEGNSVNFEMTEEETRGLKAVALTGGCTLFMVLVSVVDILLSKLSGQEEIIIGTPIAGRRHADLEKIIGMFVNTLSLKNHPSGDRTLREFLGGVKEKTLMAFENQEYPFEELVNKLSVERDIGRNPLFDIMFVMQNMNTGWEAREDENAIETTRWIQPGSTREYKNTFQTAKFDLTLRAIERGGGIFLSFQYCTKLFKKETVERFIIYFKKIVSITIKEWGIKINEIEIIPEEEKNRLLYEFNDTGVDYPKDKTVHRWFEEQAEQTPDNVVVIGLLLQATPGTYLQIAYRELNEKSNRLARLLQIKGIDAGTTAAIMIEPCIEMIVGILAVLKCGAGYLPIDPMNPEGRIEYLLTDSEAKLLLTHPPLTGKVNVGIEILNIADEGMYTGEALTGTTSVKAGGPVYMIYTSGTTGNPKGVQIKHENLLNYVNWFSTETCLTADDKTALTSSFAFDLGYSSLYPSLLKGARLHLLSKEIYMEPGKILNLIHQQGITYLKMTPSLFSTIVMHHDFSADTCRRLRLVILGGEAINTPDVERAYRICPHLVIMNHYGPTETTIGCIAQFIDRGDLEAYKMMPTIGRPIFNTQVYILDRYLNLLPVGIVGELCIGGAGVAKGYFKRDQLTGEKFVEIEKIGNAGVYRTGDLGRWLSNGNIEFLGRIDQQVKIRGFRVELGEIETRLLNYPGLREVVVWVREEVKDDKYICAYFVSNSEYKDSELREYLSKELPDYMIPSYFVRLEKIPLTANGKIDRKVLPKPELKAGEGYTAPGDEIEKKLVELWSEVLNIKKDIIGIDSSFFQLGGHSLHATVLASKITRALDIQLPVVEIFKTPTVRGLRQYLKTFESKILSPANENLVLLKRGIKEILNIFFIHDVTGEVEGYMELCNQLNIELNCWGIRADVIKNYTPHNTSIEEIAGKYLEKIKKLQPQGPYYIAGWSLGGTIAFEMANQLERMREPIAFLALIDSPGPGSSWKRDVQPFTLENEKNFIKKYLSNRDLDAKLENITDLNELWTYIVGYLQSNPIDVGVIKKTLMELDAYAGFDSYGGEISQLITYLNTGRTFRQARESYVPEGKIHTPLHYFAAAQSGGIDRGWSHYCLKPISSYEIPGNHFSILRSPQVLELAEIVCKLFENLLK